MTATIVDEMTDTGSDKNRECKGRGLANIATGLLGGMAGCAMIGQSVINVKSGGRSRLSTLVAGVALLLMVVFLSDWVGRIPMAALVAVMIMVSIGTFRWESIRNLKRYPLSTNLVMLVTVGVVLATTTWPSAWSRAFSWPRCSSPTRSGTTSISTANAPPTAPAATTR